MTAAHIVNTLLYIMPCFILLFLTFKDKFNIFDSFKIAAAILIFMVITFCGSGFYEHYRKLPPKFFLISLTAMVLGALIFNFTVGYHFRHAIFIVSIAKCYSDHVYFLAVYIHFLIFQRLPAYTNFGTLPFSIIILVIIFPFIYSFFRKTLRQALDYSLDFSIWHVMWIIPVCNNFLFNLLFSPNISNYNISPDDSFYYAPPIWVILTFATYAITLQMAIITSENVTLSEKYHISETLLLSQQKQTEILQKQIEQTSRTRHDLRHHLLIIETHIINKDWDALETYVKTYRTSIPEPSNIYCKNTTINSLIGYYKEMAEQSKTKLDVSVSLSDVLTLPSTDLCSVLANLLENAVDACSRMKSENRFIDLKISSQSDSVLAIVIENSYEDEIKRFNDTFISSKNKNRKGIGISSIRNIVEQYNGIAKFEYQDHVFKASLLMRAPAS